MKEKAHLVEAYMTHSRTPFITERFSDDRIRKTARPQAFGENGPALELKRIKAKYGKKWTGIKGIEASQRLAERLAKRRKGKAA